jgi:hypothetical protein
MGPGLSPWQALNEDLSLEEDCSQNFGFRPTLLIARVLEQHASKVIIPKVSPLGVL